MTSSHLTGALLLSSALATLAPAAARGQEPEPTVDFEDLKGMEIEQLMQVQVSTISRMGERLDLAPGSIHVYSRDLIRRRGYRTLGELLQTVPGFTVFHRDQQFVVGVRGLNANDNDKMSLLINGQRVLGLHEQEILNGPMNLDNVERVEVVVGPSSLFQQADTLAATVNLITLRPDGGELDLAAGTDVPYAGTVMVGRRWGEDRALNLALTLDRKQGFDAWINRSRPFLPGRALTGELDWPSFFGMLGGQYGELSGQAVAYRSAWPELWINGADPSNRGRFVESFYSLMIKDEHHFGDGLRSVVSAEAALKGQVRSNEGGPPINATSQSVKQRQYRADASLRHSGLVGHRLQAGVQASFDDNYDTWFTFDDVTANPPVHIPQTTLVDRDTWALGFYVDDDFELSNRLKLVAGARLDHNTRLSGGRWYPAWRAGIITQPTGSWVAKLVSYRAVRMPSPFEALNQVFGTNNPDSMLKPGFANKSPTASRPERLTTVELQNIVYGGPVRASATVYYQDLQDFITWFQPHSNGGDFGGFGAEADLHASFDRLTVWANAAWNDSRLHLFNPVAFGPVSSKPEDVHAYVNGDERIIGSVRYTANLGLDLAVLRNLQLSPSLRYFTGQAADGFDPNASMGYDALSIDNRLYLDATLSWVDLRPVAGAVVDVRLSVTNLLNDRRPVAAQLFGDVYRPRGIAAVAMVDLRL
jgi:iron complex outermembrane receptor protein